MKRIKSYSPYIFLTVSMLILVISMFYNRGYFSELSIRNVYWYQSKQVLSILCLFILGFLFLKIIQHKMDDLYIALMSFPAGICLWCFMSEFLLAGDRTYRLWRVCFLIALFLIAFYCLRRFVFKMELLPVNISFPKTLAIVIGVACLVSTGCHFVVYNYDSYAYFSNYGKSLPLLMSYRDFVTSDSFVLTNIGQFLPLAVSYITYWGLDSITPIHAFMFVNLLISFGAFSYRFAKKHQANSNALTYALFFTAMLLSCSPFFIFGTWVLSNSWLTFFLFYLFLILDECKNEPLSFDYLILLCGFSLAVTMLRKDGLAIMCFAILCFSYAVFSRKKKGLSAKSSKENLQLLLAFLPSVLYLFYYIYYLKKVIYATTRMAFRNSLLNDSFVKMLFAFVAVTILYLLLLRIPCERFLSKWLCTFCLLSELFLLILQFMKRRHEIIDFFDVWTRNLLGTAFGYTLLNIGILLIIIVLCRPKEQSHILFVLGYVLLIFNIYWNKSNLETNLDNSGLRGLIQILPCFYFIAFQCFILISKNFVSRKRNIENE